MVLAFAVLAFLIVPVSYGDKRVYVVDGRELDATQGCLLTGAGIDRLLTTPRSFYDTAILYPDHDQLRSTEPFLGYALLGLPLRVLLRLNDVDVFEVLRWAIVFTSLTYAYLLFRMLGVALALSVAGAAMCVSSPGLVNGIERLQVLSMPLFLPVVYHALALWKSDRPSTPLRTALSGVALFFFTALYPLCGAINATVATLAALCAFPLLLVMLADLRKRRELAAVVVPVAVAAIVDAVVLAPWLLDRSDLTPYVTAVFLEVKHWNPTNLPLRLQHIQPFLAARAGWSIVVAGLVLAAAAAKQHIRRIRGGTARVHSTPPPERHLLVLLVAALALLVAAAFGVKRQSFPLLGILFDLLCVTTVLWNWSVQLRVPPVNQDGFGGYIGAAAAGVAVFLCVVSFGPVYAGNLHPLATNFTRLLFHLLPPLMSIREYDRIWTFGMLFASIYVTVRLGIALRESGRLVRNMTAVVVMVPLVIALRQRPLVASAPIEAPRDFVASASHSFARGPIYVHPVMKWNSRSGVLMVAIARDLGRPVVNGCLGICPPWFIYATTVLHRFPDPEALWLLRHWRVETVVGVTGDVVGGGADGVVKVYENNQGHVVWEIGVPTRDTMHPSMPANPGPAEHQARIDAKWSQTGESGGTGMLTASVPAGFVAQSVEVQFGQSIVQPIPDEITILGFEGSQRVRMNRDHAGEWIHSLAADALVRRESPRAAIALKAPLQGRFQIECRNAAKPPIARIQLVGAWPERSSR